jgi:hypothetical protein
MHFGVILSALGFGLILTGCSASSGGDGFSATAQPARQWTLHVKSEPSGAEAKAPDGQSCRTPCELLLPMTDTSVTVSLDGYYAQTIPVKWLPATFHYEMYEHTEETGVSYPTDFSPNPVIAKLERGPSTPPAKRRPPKRKTTARSAPPAHVAPQGAASPAPPSPTR